MGADVRRERYKEHQDWIETMSGALPKLASTDKDERSLYEGRRNCRNFFPEYLKGVDLQELIFERGLQASRRLDGELQPTKGMD